jgi:hypothetical protein
MKINIEVADKLIASQLTCAAIGYWAKSVSRDQKVPLYMELIEAETNRHFTIDEEALTEAIALMAEKAPTLLGQIMADNGDSISGDVLVQYATFGEHKYG